jgi:DnaJ-domain-containing protein 1
LFLHLLQKHEHKIAFLELANRVAEADGVVNRKERGYIKAYADEMELNAADILHVPERQISDILGELNDKQVQHVFFMEILLLTFADGDYNDDEKHIVKEMKTILGMSDDTYEAFKNLVIRMDRLKIEGIQLILNPKMQ